MLEKRKKSGQDRLIFRRFLWTIGIIFVYMLGKYSPLATLPIQDPRTNLDVTSYLDNLAMVTGGHFSSLTLFSLGLSPWMTTMILWRFLTLFKVVKTLTARQSHLWRMVLMLLVAGIQAFGFSAGLDFLPLDLFGYQDPLFFRLATMVILVAGAYVLMWLGNLNGQKGIGGQTVIIIANMILTFLVNSLSYLGLHQDEPLFLVLTFGLLAVIVGGLVLLTVRVYRAEYRIPIRRIMVISSFADHTYIPIRLTPAGGMPFMYAMTLMSLPPLMIQGLLSLYPQNQFLAYLATHSSIQELPGMLAYIFLLFLLAIGFAYFNTDPGEIAEQMQKNGDFIEGIRPGKATQDYINTYLKRLTAIGAIYTCFMGGLPLVLVWSQGGEVGLALLINNVYIVTSLLLGLVEQVHILQSWKEYKDLI